MYSDAEEYAGRAEPQASRSSLIEADTRGSDFACRRGTTAASAGCFDPADSDERDTEEARHQACLPVGVNATGAAAFRSVTYDSVRALCIDRTSVGSHLAGMRAIPPYTY